MTVLDVALDQDDFGELGGGFEDSGVVVTGRVGAADCRFFSVSYAIAFAVRWMGDHRSKWASTLVVQSMVSTSLTGLGVMGLHSHY